MARPARTLLLLSVATSIAVLIHLSPPLVYLRTPDGHESRLAYGELLGAIARGPGQSDNAGFIVWNLRLPRAALCLLAGALLGATGSAFQALLRNPLADPFVLGVSGGAAVGGSVALALGYASGLATIVPGFAGGMLALALVYGLATRRGVIDVQSLILAGTVVGSLLSSILTLVLLGAGKDTTVVLRWLLGDASNGGWLQVALLLGALLIGLPMLVLQSRRLNALALGTDAARRLGADPVALTRVILFAGGLMTAATVGTVGIIGFLGLVAPHLSRRLLGVDWRWSLPGAALVGALLLVLADLIAQRLLPAFGKVGMELPVGAVTSVLGAPTLLVLLKKRG